VYLEIRCPFTLGTEISGKNCSIYFLVATRAAVFKEGGDYSRKYGIYIYIPHHLGCQHMVLMNRHGACLTAPFL
jgi:hypothetical protein